MGTLGGGVPVLFIKESKMTDKQGSTLLIGLSGKMGSGKSSVAKALVNKYDEGFEGIAKIISLSEPIRQLCQLGLNRSDREAWTKFGTGVIRDGVKREFGHYDFWPNYFVNTVQAHLKRYPMTIIVCDDVRHINEVEALEAIGFTIIRLFADEGVRRKRCESIGKDFDTTHESETALDDYPFTFNILNNFNNSLSAVVRSIEKLIDHKHLNPTIP